MKRWVLAAHCDVIPTLPMTHPIHRRIWAEELVRRPRTDEWLRYAASQRRGRIDPNPHQIDAVLFALRKIQDGGCILADEVGLGKTIEAGLVVAQLLAEGARRILFILPKALLGQWKSELYNLFGLDSREGGPDPARFHGEGIFVVGREFAGSERGASLLNSVEPFDLCVIDEAHDFLPDGTPILCTMQGDVWRVEGPDDKLEKVRWRRIAAGLHHALGLVVADRSIYVLSRDQINSPPPSPAPSGRPHEPIGTCHTGFHLRGARRPIGNLGACK